MPEFTLKSGAKLVASMAAFEDGNELRKAVARCMAKAGLDGFGTDTAVQALMADDEVERRVFACGNAASYCGAKVNRALFDNADLREKATGDYFEIVAKLLEVNLNPFFRTASSASTTQVAKAA